MPGGDFFIVMLLVWTLVGRRVDGERVTGVLHGRVELRGPYGLSPDVNSVQWNKYLVKNSTKRMLYWVKKPNNTTCTEPCKNIDFNLQNMSLILVNLTQEDEGVYEERTSFKNNTVKSFNVTLCLQVLSTESPPPSCNTTSSPLNGTSAKQNNTEGTHSNIAKHIFKAGFSLIGLLVLCIILVFICKCYGRRKMKSTPREEPIYNEPSFLQEEPAPLPVDSLLVVYQDFIRPNHSQQSNQCEDFGYSTIADVVELTTYTKYTGTNGDVKDDPTGS
ncbi:uncharacterized protein Hap1MRO34_019962 [Clarias gariepinus]|uniref:uncharacterized protein LOC128505420 n=1 Tax=Clarias gariepinus TaxID=13013 RepID=UPI00234D650C|nr:uncharacterized protein LOC128505420 [Clarias gariepinus]